MPLAILPLIGGCAQSGRARKYVALRGLNRFLLPCGECVSRRPLHGAKARLIQRMAQAGHNHSANERWVTKAHLCFSWVDVYIYQSWRQVEKQSNHGMPVTRQHFGISPAHRADKKPVLYRTTIDEQKLMIGNAAIISRQAGNPAKPHTLSLKIQGNAVVDKFAASQSRHTFRPRGGRLHRQHTPPVMLDHKTNVRPRHRKPLHSVQSSGIFGARAAQEFAPCGHIAEQVFNPHPRAMR